MARSPSPKALIDRARSLVVRMHAVERWAYAIDASMARDQVHSAILQSGYTLEEEDTEARVSRYEAPPNGTSEGLVLLGRPDLGVTLLQAFGRTTPDRLSLVLEATGFVPQSSLLSKAYDVASPSCRHALTALAHMVVAWDDDWADLFLLHLASPDPVVRRDATLSTVVAAMSAQSREPARTLLTEAHQQERFPKLKTTMAEAITAVDSIPVSISPSRAKAGL